MKGSGDRETPVDPNEVAAEIDLALNGLFRPINLANEISPSRKANVALRFFSVRIKLCFADSILVSMNEIGSFVVMAPNNPFGIDTSTQWNGYCSSNLSFLLPTDANSNSSDPSQGHWVTPGTGWVSANNVTLKFDGLVSLSMNGASNNGAGSFNAGIAGGGYVLHMFVMRAPFSSAPETIPDGNLQNILHLPTTDIRARISVTLTQKIFTRLSRPSQFLNLRSTPRSLVL